MFLLNKRFWKFILYCILAGCVSYTAYKIFKVPPPPELSIKLDSPEDIYPITYQACFAPRYNGIVFDCHFGNIRGLFVMDMAGKVFKTLYQSGKEYCGSATSFALSPDGRWLAMMHYNDTKSSDIALTDLDTGHTEIIMNTPENEHDLAFSPDSKRLFFVRSRRFEIVVGNFSGYSQGSLHYYDLSTKKEFYVLGDNLPARVHPNPLPDNEHVLIQVWNAELTPKGLERASRGNQGHNLWLININDVQKSRPVVPDMMPFILQCPEDEKKEYLEQLKRGEGLMLEEPVLSRDGKYLAFMWFRISMSGKVTRYDKYRAFLTRMSDLKPSPLANRIDCYGIFDISPDNQLLLLFGHEKEAARTHPYCTNLWIVRRDGTDLREIVPDFMDHKVRKRCKLIIPADPKED